MSDIRQRILAALDTVNETDDADELLDLKWQLHQRMGQWDYGELCKAQVVVMLAALGDPAVWRGRDTGGQGRAVKRLRIVG